jgi:DNA-binding NtrC family response regulator
MGRKSLTHSCHDSNVAEMWVVRGVSPTSTYTLKERRPGIEVIAMTNHETVRFAVNAMKAGAYDVITEPFGLGGTETSAARCREPFDRQD